eukprot:SAG31_NODE_1381_length_8580_cov_5.632590_3_plen_60_part_00
MSAATRETLQNLNLQRSPARRPADDPLSLPLSQYHSQQLHQPPAALMSPLGTKSADKRC